MTLKYLVTGTGRCGTVFMARFLTSVGLPCGHESFFDWCGIHIARKRLSGEHKPNLSHASTRNDGDPQASQWLSKDAELVAESSYLAAPYLKDEALTGVPVIHVVRHPVSVVNSFCNFIEYFAQADTTDSYQRSIYSHVPALKQEMPRFDRASLFYVEWNEMIERADPAFFHRIEDSKQGLADFLGVSLEGAYAYNRANTYARWTDTPFDVTKIESDEIRRRFIDIARRYGYRVATR